MYRYLAFLTAGVAAGIGLGEMDLLEAQAKSIAHSSVIVLDLGAGAASTFENFLDNQICPEVDSEFVLPADTCNVDLLKANMHGVSISWYDSDGDEAGLPDAWQVSARVVLPGNFVAD